MRASQKNFNYPFVQLLLKTRQLTNYFFFFVGQKHKVQCIDGETMKILIALPDDTDSTTTVYLDGHFSKINKKCEPTMSDNLAVFELSLIDYYECGILRVVNKITVRLKSKYEYLHPP